SYFTSDPYFNGFQAGLGQASTYHVAPYEQSANVPGQWDMHAIKLEHAFEYSQSNNGSSVSNVNALGSANIKIAIIDTGEDPTHPELTSKIAAQKCFITNTTAGTQSTSDFAPDPQGHGSDVSGIAAADSGNAFGFVGAGGKAVIYAYRVFPEPDDTCANETGQDAQCSADSFDIASAINDAVAKHVNVISMSLGGNACSNGQDPDSVEGHAVADAIAANIVVVAASGNDGTASVDAPSCDPGVIAVGASALGDGQQTGSNSGVGSSTSPVEYVPSYSNFGNPAAAVHSSSAWGIVAPGGDPYSSMNDSDTLHWIANVWTSEPFDSKFSANESSGCTDDYPNVNGTNPPVDCQVLIAGTSMATPHVAGAVALILAVNSTYQSPTKMKQLLCSTADDISDPNEGCGRLNVYRAMATALNDPQLP
ncbi:MAG TPA: S8 family serine peptidase, partial [Candidatus Baltobacteraceae bacterium]